MKFNLYFYSELAVIINLLSFICAKITLKNYRFDQ